MADVIFDLFGNPTRPGKGQRGRPPFEVTERNSNKVKLLLAMGWSNERISHALECSLATLRRYFRRELAVRDQMRDRLDAERIMAVAEKAFTDGVIGAHRELDRLIERNDRMEAERKVAQPQRQDRGGKKEERAQMAHDAEAELMKQLDLEAAKDVRH